MRRLSSVAKVSPPLEERRIFCRFSGEPPNRGRFFPVHRLAYRPCAYALIFDENGKLLMVSSQVLSVHWNLPGGGVNRGETLLNGLRREVREEAGLEIEVDLLVTVMDDFVIMATGQPVQSHRHFYLAHVIGGQFRPEGNGFDSDTVRYLDTNAMKDEELDAPHIMRPVIEKARFLLGAISP